MRAKNYDNAYLERFLTFFDALKDRSYDLLHIELGRAIADIGCGTGKDSLRIASLGAVVTGIDHDPDLITIANQNAGELPVHFLCCEADNIPLANQSLDVVRYDRIFQHLPNHNDVLAEAGRLLNPNGIIQIIDLDYLSITTFLEDEILERKIIDSVAYQRLPNAYKVRRLPTALRRAGFSIDLVEVHNYLVKDFTFLNYAIRFNKQVPMLLKNGIISQAEFDRWKKHINKPEGQFTASLNMLIFMARKNCL